MKTKTHYTRVINETRLPKHPIKHDEKINGGKRGCGENDVKLIKVNGDKQPR